MTKLQGKVAVITGGTSGIGLATAKRLVNEGAYVFITGRRQAELDAAVANIGSNVTGVRSDVSRLEDLDHLYDVIRGQQKQIDILFVNAGGGEFAPLGEITEEHYEKTFNINVKGTIFTVQKALPLINDGASIILASSTAASSGMPAFSIYSATKAAIRSFARGWIVDLQSRKVRINAISPGVIHTPGLTGLAGSEEESQQFLQQMAQSIPLGRVGQPEEIAGAVAFLASEDSSFINGIELFVDGGMRQI
ncbi:SDR family NAD(P)-dependent oxidoreductase [Paenibacillus sp. NFR01]|uniref:SDR family NAD(P)-dependent oxidoreductase n=1 Tax=Paenibacillus sp. NFR01 TaxID=1566279 RepID=UPI0008B9B818|nr:SDR family oxidoreductase [Paenibacillus sp. NFR01]SET15618.1 NAD(P)-dependent dehydrogenase, short-chain alcohol dehydrogenase family [Paenibacillus sp. NFR01]